MGFACLSSRNADFCCIWQLEPGLEPLELGPEPQLARNGRRWLGMAARARPGAAEYSTGASRVCPGAAECSMGAARDTQEPQNARRVPLEPPRNRRMLDGCRSSHLGGAECSTGAARACPGAAACSNSAARAHSREVRSFRAFKMAARKVRPHVRRLSASTFARLHFASCMLCTGSH